MPNKELPKKVEEDVLPDYSRLIDFYFTREYSQTYSLNYQEGDLYINEFRHFWTVVASMIGQTSGEEDLKLVYEKNLFKITCPFFTEEEDFYPESLDYYLLFYGFYNTINIVSLLEKSVEDLLVNNFYNKGNLHLYCFYNSSYTQYNFEVTEKFEKNTKLIEAMTPLLWNNEYYILVRDVLQLGSEPFLVNGEPLLLDIVSEISGDIPLKDFRVTPSTAYVYTLSEDRSFDFTVELFGGLMLSSLQVTSSDPSIAIVETIAGRIIRIQATSYGVSGSATITVTSPLTATMQELTFIATGFDAYLRVTPNSVDMQLVETDTATFSIDSYLVDVTRMHVASTYPSDPSYYRAEFKNDGTSMKVTILNNDLMDFRLTVSAFPELYQPLEEGTIEFNIAPLPNSGVFFAGDLIAGDGEIVWPQEPNGDRSYGTFIVNLNTTTGGLTLEEPNGDNIVFGGLTGGELGGGYAPNILTQYLTVKNSDYISRLGLPCSESYTPTIGDIVTVSRGIAVSPGEGYALLGCTVARIGVNAEGQLAVYFAVTEDVTDVRLVHSYTVEGF